MLLGDSSFSATSRYHMHRPCAWLASKVAKLRRKSVRTHEAIDASIADFFAASTHQPLLFPALHTGFLLCARRDIHLGLAVGLDSTRRNAHVLRLCLGVHGVLWVGRWNGHCGTVIAVQEGVVVVIHPGKRMVFWWSSCGWLREVGQGRSALRKQALRDVVVCRRWSLRKRIRAIAQATEAYISGLATLRLRHCRSNGSWRVPHRSASPCGGIGAAQAAPPPHMSIHEQSGTLSTRTVCSNLLRTQPDALRCFHPHIRTFRRATVQVLRNRSSPRVQHAVRL